MPKGPLIVGSVKFETVPSVWMRPMELLPRLVNHRSRFPAGPAVICHGLLIPAPVKLEMTPLVVIRPMLPWAAFVGP